MVDIVILQFVRKLDRFFSNAKVLLKTKNIFTWLSSVYTWSEKSIQNYLILIPKLVCFIHIALYLQNRLFTKQTCQYIRDCFDVWGKFSTIWYFVIYWRTCNLCVYCMATITFLYNVLQCQFNKEFHLLLMLKNWNKCNFWQLELFQVYPYLLVRLLSITKQVGFHYSVGAR